MDVQTSNIKQDEGFFSKYFKNFVLVLLVIIIISLIVFIKYGSNNFLWETKKENKDSGGNTRLKRDVEERIREIRESEKLTLDLAFLEQMDNMEILENRISELENELKKMKENNKDSANFTSLKNQQLDKNLNEISDSEQNNNKTGESKNNENKPLESNHDSSTTTTEDSKKKKDKILKEETSNLSIDSNSETSTTNSDNGFVKIVNTDIE